mgnify:CR=1 FL=1
MLCDPCGRFFSIFPTEFTEFISELHRAKLKDFIYTSYGIVSFHQRVAAAKKALHVYYGSYILTCIFKVENNLKYTVRTVERCLYPASLVEMMKNELSLNKCINSKPIKFISRRINIQIVCTANSHYIELLNFNRKNYHKPRT